MKKIISGIIVVEGKSDIAFLNSFIDAEFVTTNGSAVDKGVIDYLKEASKSKEIYVLTDPDFPGKQIRDTLDKNIPNLHHCFIHKELAIKNGKVGVAEGNKDDILNALSHCVETKKIKNGNITMSDLYKLKLVGSEDSFLIRKNICEKLHIGFCNGKTFLKRLNYLNINVSDIEKLL